MAHTVVVTAAGGPLGRRVCERAAADPAVERVVALDDPRAPRPAWPSPAVEHHAVALDDPSVPALCAGAAAVLHLGGGSWAPPGAAARLDGAGVWGADDVGATRALLAALAGAGVPTLVVLSSALVYGAWPGAPVPLTEAAPLRPVPGVAPAVERAEIERLAAAWRAGAGPAVTVAVLRPAVMVGPDQPRWLARSPWTETGLTVRHEPPGQFVHLDDVASAVDHARRRRLDGAFNVAPDGWLPAAERRELRGPVPRLPVPAPLAERVGALRWRLGLAGVPPAVLPYTLDPWVVANDRLVATGWRPAHRNEEAFVEADPGGRLSTVNPRRRQRVSLGLLGLSVAGAIAGVVAGVRRLVTSHRR